MKSQIFQLAAHVLVLSAMSASAAIRYVRVNSANPTSPPTNWTNAATTIQSLLTQQTGGMSGCDAKSDSFKFLTIKGPA